MSNALDVTVPMPTWGFQRDDLPSSVHGLMSLWGGFDSSADVADNASCEKRFEVDISFSTGGNSLQEIDRRVWEGVFSSVGESVLEVQRDESVHFYRSPSAALVVLRNKVVMSAAATVPLHQAVSPILDACTKGDHLTVPGAAAVEWASFMRKNLSSPWDPDNDIQHAMAKEYAQLKHRFPQGKSYLIGPVDGDHYFYFVHDAVDRQSGGVTEDDVQLNLVMYQPTAHDDAKDSDRCSNKVSQTCVALGVKGEYELFRRFTTCGQSCVTFETNCASQDHATRIVELLAEHQPERFTLITLFDPHTVVARRLAAGDRCGLDKFAGYTTDNCCTNEFAHGYIVRKAVFVRSL